MNSKDLVGSVWDEDKLLKALMDKVEEGDLDEVEHLIKQGANVNKIDDLGKTPLMHAAKRGFSDIIRCLVEQGGDVNQQDNMGKTPLMYAADRYRPNIVQYLVEHGANVNKKDNDGKTPLMYAAERRCQASLEYLIRHKANINEQDELGKTALIYATKRGFFHGVRYLVEHGAKIDEQDNSGKTALMYALRDWLSVAARYFILKGANVNKKDMDGKSVFRYILDSCDRESLELAIRPRTLTVDQITSILIFKDVSIANVIDLKTKDSMRQIREARNIVIVRDILEREGVNVEKILDQKKNLEKLIRVVQDESLTKLDKESLAKKILDCVPDVNYRNSEGRTILSIAVDQGEIGIANMLIKKGIDLDDRDNINKLKEVYIPCEDAKHSKGCVREDIV